MMRKLMCKADSIDLVLGDFAQLRERLETIANRHDARITEIDAEVAELESEGMVATENRDRALKVANNVRKVFDV